MSHFLILTVVILLLVVLLGLFNEKVTKLTYEISLMLFSAIVSSVLLLAGTVLKESSAAQILENLHFLNLETFLMDGVLCFMLFAGSCHMRFGDLRRNARPVAVLSMGATLAGAVLYGVLFFGVSQLIGLKLSLPVCLMFGSIIAPTDPIAATSILRKFDLPPNISFIMEGESLFNDGVGVALFVCFSGLVSAQESGGFLSVMAKELFGAAAVGVVVTAVCFLIFRATGDPSRKIFTSLLAVSACYVLCEAFGFSGAIASVVCGILFSILRSREEEKGQSADLEHFDSFWELLDQLFNSVLYVMLGLSLIHILQMPYVILLSVTAVILNLAGRFGSLAASTLLIGKLPDQYDRRSFIMLLTWGGLRGGLSVALAMSTQGLVDNDIYYVILGGTYAVVFFTTIVQGLTMPRVYGKIQSGRTR